MNTEMTKEERLAQTRPIMEALLTACAEALDSLPSGLEDVATGLDVDLLGKFESIPSFALAFSASAEGRKLVRVLGVAQLSDIDPPAHWLTKYAGLSGASVVVILCLLSKKTGIFPLEGCTPRIVEAIVREHRRSVAS
jgi:hypothetical protein